MKLKLRTSTPYYDTESLKVFIVLPKIANGEVNCKVKAGTALVYFSEFTFKNKQC